VADPNRVYEISVRSINIDDQRQATDLKVTFWKISNGQGVGDWKL